MFDLTLDEQFTDKNKLNKQEHVAYDNSYNEIKEKTLFDEIYSTVIKLPSILLDNKTEEINKVLGIEKQNDDDYKIDVDICKRLTYNQFYKEYEQMCECCGTKLNFLDRHDNYGICTKCLNRIENKNNKILEYLITGERNGNN